MEQITYFAIIIGAIFVNNVVLAQFLGICPFLGVSSKVETSMGMGAAVTFVMALTGVVAWSIQTYMLIRWTSSTCRRSSSSSVIAALVQMVEIMLKNSRRRSIRRWVSSCRLITTNCAVLGVAILMIQKEFNLLQSVIYSVATALGFALALVLLPVSASGSSWRTYPIVQGRAYRADHGRYSRHGLHGILGAGITTSRNAKQPPSEMRGGCLSFAVIEMFREFLDPACCRPGNGQQPLGDSHYFGLFLSESFVSCRQIVIFAQITVTEMEDIIKLHDTRA